MKRNNKRSPDLACTGTSPEKRFRRLVEGLRRNYFFYCHDTDGIFQYVSPSIKNILGYSQPEFLKHFGEYLTDSASNREVSRHTKLSMQGRRQPPYEVEIYNKAREVRTLEVLEMPVKKNGRVVAVEGIARDITDQKRASDELAAHDRAMTEQARLILLSSGDGIIGVDLDGRVTFMNDSAEKLLGWRQDELKGRELHPAVHHTRPDGSPYDVGKCPMSASLRRGSFSQIESEVLWRRDGSSFPVAYSSRPIERDGVRVGAVITFRDITARRRLEEMREFLTHAMVHDLNNPLTSIMAGAELAADCPGGLEGCENRDHLSLIREAAEEMKKMLSDILDISRMEEGKIPLNRRRTAPAALAAGAAAAMDTQARAESKTIKVAARAGLPDVAVDTRLLKRVLENLLGNALRYAPKDTAVTLKVSSRSGSVRFAVADSGPGAPQSHLEKIFDKYFQSAPANGGGRKGKGLGLAFCRLAVAAHGGRIWAENLRPRGLAVCFELSAAGKTARSGRKRKTRG